MTEGLTVNGTSLDQLVWNVDDISGLLRAPPRRGDDVETPGRHGRVLSQYKIYDTVDYTLPMWVVGADPVTGLAPSDASAGAQAFHDRLDDLMILFGMQTVVIEYTRPGGTARHASCQVLESIEPSRLLGGPITGRLVVTLNNPSAFWTESSSQTGTLTGATGTIFTLAGFDRASAPCDELMIEFVGPISNPEIYQQSVGSYMAYDAVIPAGKKLRVNTATWTADSGDGTPWTVDFTRFRHGGAAARWFELAPEVGGPRVTLTHTGGGTASATITGPRKFLTA